MLDKKYKLYQTPGRWKLIQAAAEPYDHPLRVSIGTQRFWMLLMVSSWPFEFESICNFVGVARFNWETGEPDPFGDSISWTRGCFGFGGLGSWIEFCGRANVAPMPQIPTFVTESSTIREMKKALPKKLA